MEKQCKILIIDDEEIVLDSCLQILSGGDYEIRTAGNGILGVDLAEEFRPDVIFVDLKMPGISGFEVLEKIQEIDPTGVGFRRREVLNGQTRNTSYMNTVSQLARSCVRSWAFA